jgi:hypothetical protein
MDFLKTYAAGDSFFPDVLDRPRKYFFAHRKWVRICLRPKRVESFFQRLLPHGWDAGLSAPLKWALKAA